MEGLPEGVDSRFRYVLLVAKRAEQLVQGAAPKIRTKHNKPALSGAIEFLANGVIEHRHVGHAWILRDPDFVGE